MKYIRFLSLILGFVLLGCNSDTKSKASVKVDSDAVKLPDDQKDKKEIRLLIRQMLKWADSENTIEVLPALVKDSVYIGFDLDKLHQNLETLNKTGFFAVEFVENYNHIIRILDKKIKNKEFEKWNVGDLPTFRFANDENPWCSCQDNMSWDNVDVEVVTLSNDKGELKWNWGKLDAGADPSWKEVSYKFRVVKVDGKWKISHLQGFDYNESIK